MQNHQDKAAVTPIAPVQKLIVRRSTAQAALGGMPDTTFDQFLSDNDIRIIVIGRIRYVRWRELVEAVDRLPIGQREASA